MKKKNNQQGLKYQRTILIKKISKNKNAQDRKTALNETKGSAAANEPQVEPIRAGGRG